MKEYIVKSGKVLRFGYTTGSCAAAATKAAAVMLLRVNQIDTVNLITPSGVSLFLDITDVKYNSDSVSCAVVKDAGDDPDVTHGLKIFSTVSKIKDGIKVDGGVGVGRATKSGLSFEIGEAAINPVPRKMIEAELRAVAESCGYTGGLSAVISAPGGEETAKQTFNPRLGIVGGISILGTTGIVEPMSEKALIETIQTEMNFHKNRGRDILLMTPGNYGADFMQETFDIDLDTGVKCSNFIGETLDYAVYLGFKKILLAGHMGKLIKLAAGIMNTHSKTADGRMEILGVHSAVAGANPSQVTQLMDCINTDTAFGLIESWGYWPQVIESIKKKMQYHLDYRVKNQIEISFIGFIDKSSVIMSDDNKINDLVKQIKGIDTL